MKKTDNLKYHFEKQYIDRLLIIDIQGRKKNVVIYLNHDQELSIYIFFYIYCECYTRTSTQ